ncbi:hypothetical protein CsSME_00029194 [Camellia sinensis var. sinensis]
MPVVKLRPSGTPDAMKSEGNDSLDTFIKQAIGKEPPLSFSRTGDNPVQWIQLLHALDQQDLPGWPLLSPLKIQMQKCEKCSREFCSPINYRRHSRVHRRSLNVNKESDKYRDLLRAFCDKLSLDEVKEIVSLKDVTLEMCVMSLQYLRGYFGRAWPSLTLSLSLCVCVGCEGQFL